MADNKYSEDKAPSMDDISLIDEAEASSAAAAKGALCCYKEDISEVGRRYADSSYNAGKRLYGFKDYEYAKEAFEAALDMGRLDAAYYLGELSYLGRGVEKDFKRAFDYYNMALVSERPEIYYRLGCIYMDGTGAAKDKEKAKEYFLKVQSITEAVYRLGCIYAEEEDYKRALDFCKRAADEKYTPAMSMIADMYYTGRGVKKDYTKAYEYYKSAIGDESSIRALRLGIMSLKGIGTSANYSMAQSNLKKLQKLPDSDPQKPEALFYIGKMLAEGKGIAANEELAMTYYTQAALLGEAEAAYYLGGIYEKNKKERFAYVWYSYASSLGYKDAEKKLDWPRWKKYR